MRIALLVLLWWMNGAPAADLPAVPAHTAWVTDLAGVLAAEERAALEARLTAFTAAKGAQVAVLLVTTTGDEPIEGYALRVAEAWKLGRQGQDDGAILVIATADRKLRIEVGYGLEGALTDATSKRIIDETIVPHFRTGNLYAGVNAGVERMLAVIEGEALPPPAPKTAATGEALPVALFFAVFFALMFRGRGARPGGWRAPLAATASGGMTYFITAVGLAAGLSAILAVVMAMLLGGGGGSDRWVSHRRYGDRFPGGWGGFGGGGFGGGGFGGGGGGSFGGGGASGSW